MCIIPECRSVLLSFSMCPFVDSWAARVKTALTQDENPLFGALLSTTQNMSQFSRPVLQTIRDQFFDGLVKKFY
jgi:hypothetical protein